MLYLGNFQSCNACNGGYINVDVPSIDCLKRIHFLTWAQHLFRYSSIINHDNYKILSEIWSSSTTSSRLQLGVLATYLNKCFFLVLSLHFKYNFYWHTYVSHTFLLWDRTPIKSCDIFYSRMCMTVCVSVFCEWGQYIVIIITSGSLNGRSGSQTKEDHSINSRRAIHIWNRYFQTIAIIII